ncbi:MAG: DUF192 domain-containing protein [archaeon]
MANRKAIIKRTVILLVIAGFVFVFVAIGQKQGQDHNTVCFDDSCVDVELAVTPDEIMTGLMNREHLPQSRGMLFIFEDEGVHMFWMKNTLIPLDIIWMDPFGKIIYVERDAPPCTTPVCPTYGPAAGSKYVLEANAGYAEKYGVNAGDVARIR